MVAPALAVAEAELLRGVLEVLGIPDSPLRAAYGAPLREPRVVADPVGAATLIGGFARTHPTGLGSGRDQSPWSA